MFKKLTMTLMLTLIATIAVAETKVQSSVDVVVSEIRDIEVDLKQKNLDLGKLRKANKRLTTLNAKAQDCVAEYEKKVAEKKTALETLGEKHKKESVDLIKQRKLQQKDLIAAQTDLATCNAMALRIKSSLEIAEKQLQQQLAKQLLAHDDNIFEVIAKHHKVPVDLMKHTWAYSQKHGWIQNAPEHQLWIVVATLLLCVIIGLAIRHYLKPVIVKVQWSSESTGRFTGSVLGSFCHYAPYLVGIVGAAIVLSIYTKDIKPIPAITQLVYGLTFFIVALYVIRFSLAPHAPGKLFLNIKKSTAQALAKRLKILTVIMLFGYLLVETLFGSSLPDYALSLSRSIVRIAFAINLIWVLWLFKDLRGMLKQPWLRYGLSLVLVVAILADLIGYTNLSGWLMRSIFGSLFIIVVTLIIGSLSSDLLEGLEYGHTSWQRRTRRILGLTPDGHITGFFWVRLLVSLAWWSLLILLLIVIWDLSANMVEEIRVIFTNGFTVGSLKIIPARIALALLSLGILVGLSAWFQGQMRKRWVNKMPMERGAREAMVTMIGYLGVAIAILVTLGVAGLDYSNLAIVAGALSLGIGFGLQNIVNNFVSGLILLFERPIKTGDWIVVGNTEGHVKRIRIRATQIETFDRADVIVPNSELISGQVTNWMLHNQRGRIRVPIGVAYGSDTQKVKEILLEIANQHPEVIVDANLSGPQVMFHGFGDSALDFELRCFIKNIDDRINVISDLNFAIDAAFRENHIEIPFPQRDLHVKNWPGKDTDIGSDQD